MCTAPQNVYIPRGGIDTAEGHLSFDQVAPRSVDQASTWSTSGRIDAAIEQLTTADVNVVLRKYLKPDDLGYAFAGDFARKK